jgi:hypothetical protein
MGKETITIVSAFIIIIDVNDQFFCPLPVVKLIVDPITSSKMSPNIKSSIFWDVMTCSMMKVNPRFG